jgi:hypothetical protein
MPIRSRQTIISGGEGVLQLEYSLATGGIVKWFSHFENNLATLQKGVTENRITLKHRLQYLTLP